MITSAQRKLVQTIRKRSSQLAKLSDRELRLATDDLREQVFHPKQTNRELVPAALALADEAIHRVLGWNLYDVQILAAHALSGPVIAEMQTGEGKTISALPAAVYGGILGYGVHVATPNAYLARRDCEQLSPIYNLLGLSVGLVGSESSENASSESAADAYACDITYGPGYEFGFDYLRDQRWLKSQKELKRGQRLLSQLTGTVEDPRSQRGLGMAIVDEADNVLIDDAISPQVLSESQAGEAPDRDVVLLARVMAETLEAPRDFTESAGHQIQLTHEGITAVHETGINLPLEQLARPWSSYVEAALRAKLQFHRDIHYVVDEETVKIVDQSTGRIFDDRTWQSGLHQAIEAKEGLPIRCESIPLARISRQRFFGLYRHLTGMTGTIGSCGAEFMSVYRLGIQTIPLRVPSRRQVLPFRLFDRQVRKWDAIVHSIQMIHAERRPVLVGTRTILDSQILASRLDECGLTYELLNGVQNADEAEIVSRAGQLGAITIATNLAGRGTDIKLSSEVEDLGGLHVIVSECHESYRADRQLMGRCGRQGDPGSCQTFMAVDDWLIQHHAPWLGRSLEQSGGLAGGRQGELSFPIESSVRKLQRQLESRRFGLRMRQSER